MHPAFSVIFLTTLIGVGQGLFLALFTVESYSSIGIMDAQTGGFYGVGGLLALLFLIGGLVASFFHLGRPERAWRSASQWRTSWLSREVIVLPAFMAVVFLYAVIHLTGFNAVIGTLPNGTRVTLTLLFGTLGTVLAFLLFVCTGMIYACLRFLREWHTPLTVVNYTLFGGASGFTMAALYAALAAPELVAFFSTWALIMLAAVLITRGASLIRNARLKPKSTLQTAIGVKHPVITQKTQGFMGGSFNTREYFHGMSDAFVRNIKWVWLIAVFPIPALLLTIGMSAGSVALLFIAFAVQYVGLVAERWFFFAQANHPQNLYYQSVA